MIVGRMPNGSVYMPNGERAPMQYVPTGQTPNPCEYSPRFSSPSNLQETDLAWFARNADAPVAQTGNTPYGAGGGGGRTPYGQPPMGYPVGQQQQHPYGQPYGPPAFGGGFPQQQQQPQGGFPPQQQQQPFPGAGLPSNPNGPAGPSINPARAAMMGRGGGAAGGGY